MSVVDRFICRREGHLPSFVVTKTSGVAVTSWITSCQRCGKVFEYPEQAANGEAAQGGER